MKRLYEKNELLFALIWIGIYVVLFSFADELSGRIGVEKLVTAIVGITLSVGLFVWVCSIEPINVRQ